MFSCSVRCIELGQTVSLRSKVLGVASRIQELDVIAGSRIPNLFSQNVRTESRCHFSTPELKEIGIVG